MDVSRLQERGDAVQARLAIDELVVVSGPIELLERNAMLLRPLAQERVEHLLPRLRVDLRRLGQHAVEIEQTCRDAIRKPEHGPTLPRADGIESTPRSCHGLELGDGQQPAAAARSPPSSSDPSRTRIQGRNRLPAAI